MSFIGPEQAEQPPAEHPFVERGEERWILLRAMELLAKRIAGDSWEQVAAQVLQQATAEYAGGDPHLP